MPSNYLPEFHRKMVELVRGVVAEEARQRVSAQSIRVWVRQLNLDDGRLEAAGDAAAADVTLALYEMVRAYLATTATARGEDLTALGRPRQPWTKRQLTDWATTRTGALLTSARRAVVLAAQADTTVLLLNPLDDAAEAVLAGAAIR